MIFIQKHKYQKCEIVNSTFIIKGYFCLPVFGGVGRKILVLEAMMPTSLLWEKGKRTLILFGKTGLSVEKELGDLELVPGECRMWKWREWERRTGRRASSCRHTLATELQVC